MPLSQLVEQVVDIEVEAVERIKSDMLATPRSPRTATVMDSHRFPLRVDQERTGDSLSTKKAKSLSEGFHGLSFRAHFRDEVRHFGWVRVVNRCPPRHVEGDIGYPRVRPPGAAEWKGEFWTWLTVARDAVKQE